MAGMPKAIVDRANEMLKQLESQRQQPGGGDLKQSVKKVAAQNYQLSFFDMKDPKLKRLAEEIEHIEINAMTPVEAIMKLHELKKILGE
jgi:DNA mismatch repair protein MutS